MASTKYEPLRIEGLRLWMPEDNFEDPNNIDRLNQMTGALRAVSPFKLPDEDTIYCGGGGTDRIVFHVVDDAAVEKRAEALKEQKKLTSAFDPYLLVPPEMLKEEARLRELHAGLGRTSIYLARTTESPNEFTDATTDLVGLFSMLGQPIHDLREFDETKAHNIGLIFMLIQAARKHKLWTPEDARSVSETLGRGFLPFPTMPGGKKFESWDSYRGESFINRTGFVKKTPAPKRQRPRRSQEVKDEVRRVSEERAKARIKVASLEPLAKVEQPIESRSGKALLFISRVAGDRRHLTYEERLTALHSRVIGRNATEKLRVDSKGKFENAIAGYVGYIEELERTLHPVGREISKYLDGRRINAKSGLSPLIVVGNVLAAKVSLTADPSGQTMKTPGFKPSGIVDGFKAIRKAVNDPALGMPESKTDKMLGDIVEAYLALTFTREGDLGTEEVLEAPDSVEPLTQFVTQLNIRGINSSRVESILKENGVEVYKYKFGGIMRKGITKADKKFIRDYIKQSRPPQAPEGTKSVSSFAHVRGLSRGVVTALIEKHDVEVGYHAFRSKPGQSLSLEAQEQLDAIIFVQPEEAPSD